MKVKKYEAPTIESALSQVKADLGKDAVILHTRKLPPKGLFGFLKKERVEITAALDINLIDPNIKSKLIPKPPTISSDSVPPRFEEKIGILKSEIDDVKSLVKAIAHQLADPLLQNAPDSVLETYNHLLGNKVCEELAKEILLSAKKQLNKGELQNIEKLQEAVYEQVSNLIYTSGPLDVPKGKRKVIALIGPTGGGKTTTIAKLAAQFSLFKNKKVALVTADTYRIAAVEQLKTYAEIIDAPIEVIFTNEEAKEALDKHLDKDLVLIDTAGRNPHNKEQLDELVDLMKSCSPDEIYLVLSMTTKLTDQMDAIDRFSGVPIDKFIFTKLDETTTPGTMLNILAKTKKHLSYITTGQNVPEDIEIADSKKISKMIVGVPFETTEGSSKETSRVS